MTAWLAWFGFTAVFLAAFISAGWLYDRAHARRWFPCECACHEGGDDD